MALASENAFCQQLANGDYLYFNAIVSTESKGLLFETHESYCACSAIYIFFYSNWHSVGDVVDISSVVFAFQEIPW